MKQVLLMIAVVALVGCGESAEEKAAAAEARAEAAAERKEGAARAKLKDAIREQNRGPWDGTEADFEKVRILVLEGEGLDQLTELPKGLEKLTHLEVLHLSLNKLTDVKGLENLTQLTRLNLSFNELTDVKGIENLTRLKHLDLSHNELTSVKGLENLTFPREGLFRSHLDLSFNKLTDVKGLENLTQLEELHIHDNPDLTKAKIDELKKALPNCRILSNPTK